MSDRMRGELEEASAPSPAAGRSARRRCSAPGRSPEDGLRLEAAIICSKDPSLVAVTAVEALAKTERQFEGDFDEILEEVGGYGRFQWRILALMQPPFLFLGFTLLGQLWLLLEPDHWCRVPELEALGWSPQLARNISIPLEERAGREQFSHCQRYAVNFSAIADLASWRPEADTPRAVCRSGWHYDFSELYPTIVSDLDWVCDDAWKAPLTTAVFFVGSMVGTLLFGAVSDRFGRLPALVATNLTACVAGVASAFAGSLTTFSMSRFVLGMANNLQTTLALVFLTEFVGERWRGMVVNLPLATSFSLGLTLLPWIAWGAGHWRYIALSTSIPMAFPLVYLVAGIPESCRWLQQMGQLDSAVAAMRRIARENGRTVPEETWERFTAAARRRHEKERAAPEPGLRQLARHPRLRTRLLLLMFSAATVMLLFDLSSRNTDFDVDIFTAHTLLGLCEAPADLLTLLLVETVGRRWVAAGSSVLTCAAALLQAALLHIGSATAAASTTVAVLCRCCTTICDNVMMQLSLELIPTAVRARGFALIQVAGHAGSMLSPVILHLERVWRGLPQLVLAGLALLGAVSVSLLPETKGQPLPDTLAEGEAFGKEQRWLQCFCGEGRAEEGARKRDGAGQDNYAMERRWDSNSE